MSQALVIATGVRENGEREMLGFALGASEEEGFWLDFLQPDAAGIERGAIGDQRRSSRPEPVCGFADEVPQQYSQSFCAHPQSNPTSATSCSRLCGASRTEAVTLALRNGIVS